MIGRNIVFDKLVNKWYVTTFYINSRGQLILDADYFDTYRQAEKFFDSLRDSGVGYVDAHADTTA